MSLMDQAINTATDAKHAADKAAQAKTRETAKKFGEWITEKFGLEAVWVRSGADTVLERYTDRLGYHNVRQRTEFRHRFRLDDVLIGVAHERSSFGSGGPQVAALYTACSKCGTEHGFPLHAYASVSGPDKSREDLVRRIGQIMVGERVCDSCKVDPCRSCGRGW